jgi:hypothetical protein
MLLRELDGLMERLSERLGDRRRSAIERADQHKPTRVPAFTRLARVRRRYHAGAEDSDQDHG